MKLFFNFLILLLLFWGCSATSPKAVTKEIKDVSYQLDTSGNLELHKSYIDSDQNKSHEVEKIQTHKKSNNGIEKVPDFQKQSIKEIVSTQEKIKVNQDIKVVGDEVQISVESIPINDFIHLVFSEVLKLNYTLSNKVSIQKDPITLNMTSRQNKQQVFDVVQKLLAMHNIKLIKENGVLFLSKIDTKTTNAPKKDAYISFGRKIGSGVKDNESIIMFVPYSYINPSKGASMLRMAGILKTKFFYPTSNIQMLRGPASEIKQALKIIDLIDRPYYEDKVMGLVEFDYIDVLSFRIRMKEIFQVNGVSVTPSPQNQGILMQTIPEINAMLVISTKKTWIDMLMYWKTKLDTQDESAIKKQPHLYMYKVKNRKADELAQAVNNALKIDGFLSKTEVTREIKPVKKLPDNEIKKESSPISNKTVTVDLATNMLMMSLLPEDYKAILPIIEKLDVLPLQTLIEVTIAEVDMTDTFNLGFEWTIRNNGLDVVNTLVAAGGGSGLGVTFNSAKLDATINAYAEDKLLDIVSRPRILVLNNETGNINVGQQVPIIISENSASDIPSGTVNRNVSYRATGVTVGVTPTINSEGILTMNINLSLSEAQTNDTSGIDSPLIVTRTLTTSSVIHSDETIMIGGLISKNNSETVSGIPYLRDIPWLGSLFRSTSKKLTKTELIMLIHPVIINEPKEMENETQKFRSIIKTIKGI